MSYILGLLLYLFGLCVSSKYDQRVCLFSPDGRLLQAEYANEAANRGGLIACVCSEEGDFVMVTPSVILENFVDRRSVEKLSVLDDGVWMVFSGLAGDGRMVIQSARRFCINYKSQFGSAPSVAAVAKAVGGMLHRSTLSADSRPLGINVAIFGYDPSVEGEEQEGGPHGLPKIFVSRATGHVTQWKAFALGEDSSVALDKMGRAFAHGETSHITTKTAIGKLLAIMEQVKENESHQEKGGEKDKDAGNGRDVGNEDKDQGKDKDKDKDKAVGHDVYVVKRKGGRKSGGPQLLFHPAVKSVADLPSEWAL